MLVEFFDHDLDGLAGDEFQSCVLSGLAVNAGGRQGYDLLGNYVVAMYLRLVVEVAGFTAGDWQL